MISPFSHKIISLFDLPLLFTNCLIVGYTETEMSSFWWNFHHWLHWKLSKWQLPVQPVMKISSKWRHFRFSVEMLILGTTFAALLEIFKLWRHSQFHTIVTQYAIAFKIIRIWILYFLNFSSCFVDIVVFVILHSYKGHFVANSCRFQRTM